MTKICTLENGNFDPEAHSFSKTVSDRKILSKILKGLNKKIPVKIPSKLNEKYKRNLNS